MLALWIITGIILLVVLALSIPVDLTFEVATQATGRQKMRVGFFFGLVGKDLLPGKKKRPKKKPEKVRKATKGKRPSPGLIMSILRTRGLVTGVVKLVRRTLRSLHIRNLDASLRVGLPDPADTGLMYGLTWPVLMLRTNSDSVRLCMEPAFDGAVFEANVRGAVRVYPAQMAANAVSFVVSPPGLRIIRLMAVSWWKGRK